MTKRIFTLMFAAFLLLPALSALADVLYEPADSFWRRNQNSCVPLNRAFYVNGENGWLSAKKEPDSRSEVTKLKNGDTVNISYTYKRQWGLYENHSNRTTGWVPMDRLVLKYDAISFREEYKDQFYAYKGDYAAVRAAERLIFWTWPGSGDCYEAQMEGMAAQLSADTAYRDADGREWGFVGYLFGNRNIWVCLDDPANNAIPAFNAAPHPELIPPPEEWPPEDKERPELPWLAIGLTAGAVICTVALILVFWKPKKA